LGKLVHRHETTHASSFQVAEHRAAHEILRNHLGEKHSWRRRMLRLLRLLSTPFRSHSCHDEGELSDSLRYLCGVAIGDKIRLDVTSSPERQMWR
jgi:hypothetical protein